MAKTTVISIVSTIKKLVDYNIEDSDLDDLILEAINLFLPIMKQWFMDEQLYDEIGESDTFDTTALQEYVDISTETIDFSQQVILTERTNDSQIGIVSFKEYRRRFPDPSANSSTTPDIAAFFNNRLYFGPTPSAAITIYLDYIKLLAILTSSGSLPFESKYNSLVVAGVTEYLVKWLDRGATAMISSAERDTLKIKHQLITGASKNIGMNQQSQSRRGGGSYFSPRKVIT